MLNLFKLLPLNLIKNYSKKHSFCSSKKVERGEIQTLSQLLNVTLLKKKLKDNLEKK